MAVADYVDINAYKNTTVNTTTITLRPSSGNIAKLKFLHIKTPSSNADFSVELRPETGPNIIMLASTATSQDFYIGNVSGERAYNDLDFIFDYDNYIEIKVPGTGDHLVEYLLAEIG